MRTVGVSHAECTVQDVQNAMVGLQQKFASELQLADDAQKTMQAALGRQQVSAAT